jgi:hypothetical protein
MAAVHHSKMRDDVADGSRSEELDLSITGPLLLPKAASLNAALLRRLDAQCLGELGELVALLFDAGAELSRPED